MTDLICGPIALYKRTVSYIIKQQLSVAPESFKLSSSLMFDVSVKPYYRNKLCQNSETVEWNVLIIRHWRCMSMPSVATPSHNTAVTSLRDHAPSQCFPAGLSQNPRMPLNIVWAAVNQTVEVPRTIPEIACEFLSAFGSSGVICMHCHLILCFGKWILFLFIFYFFLFVVWCFGVCKEKSDSTQNVAVIELCSPM